MSTLPTNTHQELQRQPLLTISCLFMALRPIRLPLLQVFGLSVCLPQVKPGVECLLVELPGGVRTRNDGKLYHITFSLAAGRDNIFYFYNFSKLFS